MAYPDYEQTLNNRIQVNGWFDGTMTDWERLPMGEREEIAFKATGCAVAYPTWEAPCNCFHTSCRVRRGELPPIAITNSVLRSELDNGYLRFAKQSKAGRAHLARLILAIRRRARETGVYDPWDMKGGWQDMVGSLFI